MKLAVLVFACLAAQAAGRDRSVNELVRGARIHADASKLKPGKCAEIGHSQMIGHRAEEHGYSP